MIHAEHDLTDPLLLLMHAAEYHLVDFLNSILLIAMCIHTIPTACKGEKILHAQALA